MDVTCFAAYARQDGAAGVSRHSARVRPAPRLI